MISVIIPVYNVRKYLAQCIRSVKNQVLKDWECIIVDDGSTDGSGEFLEWYTRGDERFKLIHQENKGLPTARNAGIGLAQGDSLFFLDSDDWLERNALYQLDWYSDMNPDVGRIIGLDFVYNEKTHRNYIWTIVPKGLHNAESIHLFSGVGCDVGHATGCLYVRRNIPCRLEFPDVVIFEDMLFNMGLIFAGVSTLITDHVIYHYINHEGSLVSREVSQEEADKMRCVLYGMYEKYNPKKEVYNRCRSFLDNALKGKGR